MKNATTGRGKVGDTQVDTFEARATDGDEAEVVDTIFQDVIATLKQLLDQ